MYRFSDIAGFLLRNSHPPLFLSKFMDVNFPRTKPPELGLLGRKAES